VIQGSLVSEQNNAIGYNANFFYPKTKGISFLTQIFSQQVKNPIHTNFCVKTIDIKNKVVIFENGHTEIFDHLINTMPLNILLKKSKEKSSTFLIQAAKKLLCNSVANFNIGVAKPKLSLKHWVYYPEPKFPFYRIGFYHNFSENMTPANCSSLYGEISYLKKSKSFVSEKLKLAINEAKKMLGILNMDIITEKILHIPHAYVIYDQWRENNIKIMHKQLQEQKIHSIGRYGYWKYSSMQEAFLDGKAIAEKLVEN